MYLSEFKESKNLYVGKAQTEFGIRQNDHTSPHKSFKTNKRRKQKQFSGHYLLDLYENNDYWPFTVVD